MMSFLWPSMMRERRSYVTLAENAEVMKKAKKRKERTSAIAKA